MMKLWIYGDFDYLKKATLIGELSFENLRGTETYGFQYS